MWLRDLWETFRTIGATDVLDILIIASLLYVVFLWFKRTKAAFVARGIFIFAMVYILAQQADMYLTTWLFQGFFAIFVIALVVIFQEELRSFFERLAVWSLRRRSSHPLQSKEVEVLVRSAGQFARERVGALFVLKGVDPLERHIEGGEELDGRLSHALLASLFDPHSEGHDGAVIIEGNRVVRFGAHLPLSKDFSKLSGMGTRHTAALGLSERTDALCLVVSEERGTISVARDGNLRSVDNLEALEGEIGSFLRDKVPVKVEVQWRELVRRNASEKVIAVTIAVALWFILVQGFSPATAMFQVPVEARAVPEALELTTIRPAKASVTLRGLKRDLKLLNPLSLRISVDLTGAEPGSRTIPITEAHLSIPGAIRLASVDPADVELELAPIVVAEEAKEEGKGFLGLLGGGASKERSERPRDEQAHEAPADE